jgi:hypothetical protein
MPTNATQQKKSPTHTDLQSSALRIAIPFCLFIQFLPFFVQDRIAQPNDKELIHKRMVSLTLINVNQKAPSKKRRGFLI